MPLKSQLFLVTRYSALVTFVYWLSDDLTLKEP